MIKLICDRCADSFDPTLSTENGGSFRVQQKSDDGEEWDVYSASFELCGKCLDLFNKALDEFTGEIEVTS